MRRADVAQLVEHVLGKDGVSGSIPLIGSRNFTGEGVFLGLLRSSAPSSHLRLAEGLIKTAEIGEAHSEYEIRNAFSRSYYALFHASHGYLRAAGVGVMSTGRKHHGSLHAEMGRQMGRSLGQFLRSAYEFRRNSDYQPDWSVPPCYSCVERLKEARGHYYFVKRTAENLISRAQG